MEEQRSIPSPSPAGRELGYSASVSSFLEPAAGASCSQTEREPERSLVESVVTHPLGAGVDNGSRGEMEETNTASVPA